jgi:parallel beta-helix repeat protein
MRNLAKTIVLLIAALFLLSLITVQPATSKTTSSIIISIKADGTLEGTNSIQRNGNVYTFVSDIRSTDEVEIVIDASNVVLDGAGRTFQGWVDVEGNNVETKGMRVEAPRVNEAGIWVRGAGCKISNNYVSATFTGIGLFHANNSIVSGNKIETKVGGDIYLGFSNYNLVEGNTAISNVERNVDVYGSNDNTIVNNQIKVFEIGGYHNGFNNTISKNEISQLLVRSNNNVVSENIISGSISISWTEGTYLFKNTVGGILFDTSSNNVLKGNVINTNGNGFEIGGFGVEDFLQDIDNSNLINGKRIYYLVNETNTAVSPTKYPDIGFLALVNCKAVTVLNNNIDTRGMLLAFTSNSLIINNNISNVHDSGLNLDRSSNNRISGNYFNSNGVGLSFSDSNQNLVSANIFTKNSQGLLFNRRYSATDNIISENNITYNGIGIHFVAISNNTIYNNNFGNNAKQVLCDTQETLLFSFHSFIYSINQWDNGSAVGGNYWSDYNGTDSNGDGFGDSPFEIDSHNVDNYPLMKPVLAEPSLTPAPTITGSFAANNSTLLGAIVIVAVVVIGVGLIVYFKKRKH